MVHAMSARAAWMYGGSAIVGASVIVNSLVRAGGETPGTRKDPNWRKATEDYLKFQNMNPIGMGGRKVFEPTYFAAKK